MIDVVQFIQTIRDTFTTPCLVEEIQSEGPVHIGYAVFFKGQENELKLPITYFYLGSTNPGVWGIGYNHHRDTLAEAAQAMQESKRAQYARVAEEIGVLTTQRGTSLSVEKFVAEIRAELPDLEDIRFDDYNKGDVDFLVASIILSTDESVAPLEVSYDDNRSTWSIECDIGYGSIDGGSFAEVLNAYSNKMRDQIGHYEDAFHGLKAAGYV